MVLLDVITHHLSFLKQHMASQAGSSSKEVSGDIQKPLPSALREGQSCQHDHFYPGAGYGWM